MTAGTDISQPAYRWTIVAAAALILGISMGTLVNGLSAFLVPLEVHFGWERAQVSAINSFGLIGIATGGIVMGFLADRIATRTICLIGALSLSGALMLAANAQSLAQFYTLFFFAGAVGGGSLFAPVIALVGSWFRTRTGLAIGIASAGQALGQGMVPFAAGHLIQASGWQSAMTILGVVVAVTVVPLSFLMRSPPQSQGRATAATATAPVLPAWIILPALSLAALGCCTGMAVPLMHLVPLIQEVCGVGAEAGGPLLVVLIAAIGGRIFFGMLADKIGAARSWMAATAWQTTLMMGFVLLGSMQAFWLFSPLYGFGYGGVMTGVLVTVQAFAPPARRAMSTGVVLAVAWLGHALGGWQGGLFFDLTGAYYWTYANAVIAGLVNLTVLGTILLLVRRRSVSAS
ncbi:MULTISPECIES: MFS transporter [unclassified Meridianimarinicoccus]|uniref:MFS transporter n=1 Tax=unclassified Meridianimarinicoccus TaxID=2923344 RepID=UPI0018666539|nr:MFS transporter [Fluviibacterium sp. MJW13]